MLFPIKRILVCSDLSEASDEVVNNAEHLRQRVNGELDILHVSDIDLQLGWATANYNKETFYEVFVGNMARDINEKLQLQISRTQASGRPLFKQGAVIETINEVITNGETKYDLLVIGHNSHKGFFEHLMGSVARKLVASLSVPTLIVKRPVAFGKIAGLIDDTRPVNWMITSTLDFFRSFKFSEVEFISLWMDIPDFLAEHQDPLSYENNLKEEIQYFMRDGETPSVKVKTTKDFHLSEMMLKIIEEDGIDLAVMKRNRGKKLNKIIIGSETMRMLESGKVNLLILPV